MRAKLACSLMKSLVAPTLAPSIAPPPPPGYVANLAAAEAAVEAAMDARDKKIQLTKYGGNGYGHILRNIVPIMRRKGMTEEQIHTILVENPARMLTFTASAP